MQYSSRNFSIYGFFAGTWPILTTPFGQQKHLFWFWSLNQELGSKWKSLEKSLVNSRIPSWIVSVSILKSCFIISIPLLPALPEMLIELKAKESMFLCSSKLSRYVVCSPYKKHLLQCHLEVY